MGVSSIGVLVGIGELGASGEVTEVLSYP